VNLNFTDPEAGESVMFQGIFILGLSLINLFTSIYFDLLGLLRLEIRASGLLVKYFAT
jgi:hypothetical protein